MFQNPQAFIDTTGTKGSAGAGPLSGRYFINSRFATIEMVDILKCHRARRRRHRLMSAAKAKM